VNGEIPNEEVDLSGFGAFVSKCTVRAVQGGGGFAVAGITWSEGGTTSAMRDNKYLFYRFQ
jgi:hypothetical protein